MKCPTKITIIGVGLIGGSLGLALRSNGKGRYHVTGFGRHEAKLRLAKKRGAVDVYTLDARKAVTDADIIVLCTPVDRIAASLSEVLPFLSPGTIVTDVGSVKGSVIDTVKTLLNHRSAQGLLEYFVPAHPMAGLEKTGVDAAQVTLFVGARVVITPQPVTSPSAVAAVTRLWKTAGACVVTTSPHQHDAAVAVTSHLPHILAYALSAAAGEVSRANPTVPDVIAGSFRDMTRVANSDPAAWSAICSGNRKALATILKKYIASLQSVNKNLSSKQKLYRFFDRARTIRNRMS
jgi:prephenate dehydrogenase